MIGDLRIPGTNINMHISVFDYKWMFHELLVLWAVFMVLQETVMNEVSELLGESLVRKTRRVVLNDLGEHLKLCFAVLVGELACRELDKSDTKTPDISPDIVIWLVGIGRIDPFGSHVGGTASTSGLGL